MAKILCIDTTTEVCSVALGVDGRCVDIFEDRDGMQHSKKLSIFVDDILRNNKQIVSDLDAIAISGGPGSYTGLRIGTSVAKGLCYGANVKMLAISPLQSMASAVQTELKAKGEMLCADATSNVLFCPMIDARRMEVYTAIYNNELGTELDVHPHIVDEQSFADYLALGKVLFFGNGADKCKGTIVHENGQFIDNVVASAKHMISLAEAEYKANNFVDVAYYEPFYLKDFVATTPRKNVLG